MRGEPEPTYKPFIITAMCRNQRPLRYNINIIIANNYTLFVEQVRKVPIETPPFIESCAKEQTNEQTAEWRIVVVKKPKGVAKSGIELKS